MVIRFKVNPPKQVYFIQICGEIGATKSVGSIKGYLMTGLKPVCVHDMKKTNGRVKSEYYVSLM